jgi:hypothetical protein
MDNFVGVVQPFRKIHRVVFCLSKSFVLNKSKMHKPRDDASSACVSEVHFRLIDLRCAAVRPN